ncbi:MAG: hypothetical protein ABI361_01105 [Nitrososphaera sp.]
MAYQQEILDGSFEGRTVMCETHNRRSRINAESIECFCCGKYVCLCDCAL